MNYLFYVIAFFIIVLILFLMVLLYTLNMKVSGEILKPYDISILINHLPDIEKENSELIGYFLTQFRDYIFDLYSIGRINEDDVSGIISSFYGANSIFKILSNGGIIDWNDYLTNYFYPLPPNTKAQAAT